MGKTMETMNSTLGYLLTASFTSAQKKIQKQYLNRKLPSLIIVNFVGEINHFLRINFHYTNHDNDIFYAYFSQEAYIDLLIQAASLTDL